MQSTSIFKSPQTLAIGNYIGLKESLWCWQWHVNTVFPTFLRSTLIHKCSLLGSKFAMKFAKLRCCSSMNTSEKRLVVQFLASEIQNKNLQRRMTRIYTEEISSETTVPVHGNPKLYIAPNTKWFLLSNNVNTETETQNTIIEWCQQLVFCHSLQPCVVS